MVEIILGGVVGAIIGGLIVFVVKIGINSEWTNREFDTTLLIWIGGVLALLVVVGIFLVHLFAEDKSLLSPEILMALITMPNTIFSYAVGKQKGLEMAQMKQNGRHPK